MKNIIKILISILFLQSQAHAVAIKGADATIWNEVQRLQTPGSQVTKLADKQFLIETGNFNAAVNPGFENGLTTPWLNSVGSSSFSNVSSGVSFGSKALQISVGNGIKTEDQVALMNDLTTGKVWTGMNIETGFWIYNPSYSGYKVCGYRYNSSSVLQTTTCESITARSGWQYVRTFIGGGGATDFYNLALVKNGTVSGGPEIVLIDEAYVGPAKSIGQGTSPNTFTALIDTGTPGVPLQQTPYNWLGSCTIANTSEATCPVLSGIATRPFNCTLGPIQGSTDYPNSKVMASSASTVKIKSWYISSGVNTPASYPAYISCTKTGSDFVQPAITAQNFDRAKADYTPTVTGVGTGSGSFTYAYWFKEGGNATTCIYYVKDSSAGSGSVPVEFTLPGGFTPDIPANASVIGSGLTNTVSLQPLSLAVYNGKLRFFKSGAASVQGSDLAANGVYLGCVTVPMQGYGATQGAPQLLGSITSDAANAFRLESATITNNGSSCSVASTTSSFVTSLSRGSAGVCNMTIALNSRCWAQASGTGRSFCHGVVSQGTGLLTVECLDTNAAPSTPTDRNFDLLCMIPR